MKIKFVEIQNFRKLKSCRIELGDKETIFVGANNSGKTSAMDALILFLKADRRKNIDTTDFTISNWRKIRAITDKWFESDFDKNGSLLLSEWDGILPAVDVWLDVNENEIHYVSNILPSLSWDGGILGVRLRFEPKNLEKLFSDYVSAVDKAALIGDGVKVWPQSFYEFLEKKLSEHFEVNAYVLDPTFLKDTKDGIAFPQKLNESASLMDKLSFDGLFKVDIINAQRGFTDAKISDGTSSNHFSGSLTTQLRSYFDKHLDPYDEPTPEDIVALKELEKSKKAFNTTLETSFKSAINELEKIGYPGFADPVISVVCDIKPISGLDHESAVKFGVLPGEEEDGIPFKLPEKYNGLGYQNLVSMVFKLIRFRDEWMKKGKAGKQSTDNGKFIEPIHLVLIEEPEAHLHAQVQQVFISKAYGILRASPELKSKQKFTTQMVVSTHSSHIAHEVDFSTLRYFKRKQACIEDKEAPSAVVVNLSGVFGTGDETSKFAVRYLKTTHCDLFFADAVIMVEGPAERILLPHFINSHFKSLSSKYITILEIGGSHAHRLRPLVEEMGLHTLVITDMDSIESDGNAKALPARGKGLRTRNTTLKEWVPCENKLDTLLDLSSDKKVSSDKLTRVAYQYPINIVVDDKEKEVIPYTFEDALVFSNLQIFKNNFDDAIGLIKSIKGAIEKPTIEETCKNIFETLGKTSKKAEMALELLWYKEPDSLMTPKYIKDGLEWLLEQLDYKSKEYIAVETKVEEAV